MKNVTPEQKQNMLKSLAVAGVLATCVVMAWLAVQIVNVFPSALSAIVSLADKVYTYNPKEVTEVAITPLTDPVQAGEEVSLSWDMPYETGTYAFTYACTEGVALTLRTDSDNTRPIECGSSYDLGAVDSAQVTIESEKNPETIVTYVVNYFKQNDSSASISGTSTVTVVNDDLVIAPETPTPPTPPTAPSTPKPTTPKPTTPTAGAPTVSYYTYSYIPVSDPKGFVELALEYVGQNTGSGSTYTTATALKTGRTGSLQFAVQNIGTKTSDTFTYTITYPDGSTYTSDPQFDLKPQERSIITLVVPAMDDAGAKSFRISIKSTGDRNTDNNTYRGTLAFIR